MALAGRPPVTRRRVRSPKHKLDLQKAEEIDRYPTQHVGIHDLHAISKGWDSVHKRGFFQKSSSVFPKVSRYLSRYTTEVKAR